MAIYVSLKDLVERKAGFHNSPIGAGVELLEAALRNLCTVVASHYNVRHDELEYTDDHAVLCSFDFSEVPEFLRPGENEGKINLVMFLLHHDDINDPKLTSAAHAVVDQARALGECIASHFGVRFYDFELDYSIEFPMYATHDGQSCPADLQSFDPEAELTYMASSSRGDS